MAKKTTGGAEARRLSDDARRSANWKRWGPYLSERQWGTVREDYSPDGSAWTYFPHDHARSRAYRWGEDGLLGITDRECRICFAIALWNGRDPILKERLFGLSGEEGNHGEDVKEEYFYLDNSPTHSYMKALYKYPQREFPYGRLVAENQRRSRDEPEYELVDTGAFAENRYFDVFAEYAKGSPNDILIKITAVNRGPDVATLHLLPTIWFRNNWTWGCRHEGCKVRPTMKKTGKTGIDLTHESLGLYRFDAEPVAGATQEFIFTENETNLQRVFGVANASPFVKDAFHEYVISQNRSAVNAKQAGTKAAVYTRVNLKPGESFTMRLRLSAEDERPDKPFDDGFERIFKARVAETDEYFASIIPRDLTPDQKRVNRQAYAGLLWSKQFYHYIVADWMDGDTAEPPPPPSRKSGRNSDWGHLYSRDVISMPDKWEYPWFAAWDLAFHMIPLAKVDPEMAKEQLVLMLREWYMHPNGQLPAYEWAFGDANPPVHAWACWRVYKMTGPRGKRDRVFLSRVFQKLLMNFTWWVNRKDVTGKHIFSGGFLGLDNIGLFDRSKPLPTGGVLEQADGTAWMAFYCATMLAMALELSIENPATQDIASKFFEHFVAIVDAMNTLGGSGLWNDDDGFYYDQLQIDGKSTPLRVRSMVGLIPLFAAEVLEHETIARLPGFRKRMHWFLENRKDLSRHISYMTEEGDAGDERHFLLAVPSRERLQRVLKYLLDEQEFLSPHGVRSLSRVHKDHPCILNADGKTYRVEYEPAESRTSVFGGNSNWRGPIWFPVNYLLIEALERYHHFYEDNFQIECPTGSGRMMNLKQVADELATRLSTLFQTDATGRRPCTANDPRYQIDPNWKDLILFHEYFNGDTGQGLGASHQTGWTALVTRLLDCKSDFSLSASVLTSSKR